MPRIKFHKKEDQKNFLVQVQQFSGLKWPKLAEKLGVHKRTLFDWRRGKLTISEKSFKKCLELVRKISLPQYKVLPDFWSVEKAARKGGLMVAQKYGGPGTPDGRRKGGIISQQKRRLHPELYRYCNLRKKILKPLNTPEFAELIGIILGDGGINNNYQAVITLHKENDKKYITFVRGLIKKLFGFSPAIYHYRSPRCKKVVGITTSSAALVEFLLSKGLKKGSKIKHQIGVPDWIKNKIELSRSCLRGLIDTDGGVYYHRHKSHGYQHFNIGLQFTNKSKPLVDFVNDILSHLGFTPKIEQHHVNLYQEPEVLRYAEEIQFRNPYHFQRIQSFLKKKYGGVRRIGKAHAWRA